MSGLRSRLADAHRSRLLVRNTRVDTTPPPPHAFAAFGAGSRIVAPARISGAEYVGIGRDVVVDAHAWFAVAAAVPGVTPILRIGDRTRIGPFSHLACVGDVDIGPDVTLGDHVLVADTYHRYDDTTVPVIAQPMAAPQRVAIGAHAELGARSMVLLGVSVGEHACIDAGALVTNDVAPWTRVAGNPARVTHRWDDAQAGWVSV